MNKLQAIQYLFRNNIHTIEWKRVHVYEVIAKILNTPGRSQKALFSAQLLKEWLKEAEEK